MSIKEKLDLKLAELLKERECWTSKKFEIDRLNYYIDEIMVILEPIRRVSISIKLNEFLSELDDIKTVKTATIFKDKFIGRLQKS